MGEFSTRREEHQVSEKKKIIKLKIFHFRNLLFEEISAKNSSQTFDDYNFSKQFLKKSFSIEKILEKNTIQTLNKQPEKKPANAGHTHMIKKILHFISRELQACSKGKTQ